MIKTFKQALIPIIGLFTTTLLFSCKDNKKESDTKTTTTSTTNTITPSTTQPY